MATARFVTYAMLTAALLLAVGAATVSIVGNAIAVSNGNPSASAEPEVSAGKNPQPNPPPPSQGKH